MMGEYGQLISRPRSSEAFFGASSGFSFVCRTLEIFLKVSEAIPSTTNIHSSTLDLFDGPIPEKLRQHPYQANLQDLPTRDTTSRLLDSLFARCSLIAQFLNESEFRQMMARIYQPAPVHREAYSERALMLAHSALALGYLYHAPLHRTQGCGAAVVEGYVPFLSRGPLLTP